jgi:hypothetical protein
LSEFEYLLSFYGLLLGLSVANVATGFADMWRARSETAVGWCTPLLALYVLLASSGAWINLWNSRAEETVAAGPLLLSLAHFFPIIFISRAMFPRSGDGWSSLEDYYMAHRRVLVGAVIATRLVGAAGLIVAGEWPGWLAGAYLAARLALLTTMLLVGSVWLHRAGWAAICLGVVWMLFA